jgi:hypothetical protein
VLIFLGKILFDIMPGMSQETSWTLVNLSYMAGSYLMFHYVRGVPFDFNAGAFDNLNMWEQIDNGDQYTPAKKFLLTVPILLFLVSTHYTHYDSTYFIINCLATLAVVVPKLPSVGPHLPLLLAVFLLTPPATPATIFLLQLASRRRLVAELFHTCISRLGVITHVFLVNPAVFRNPSNWVALRAGVASGAHILEKAGCFIHRQIVCRIEIPPQTQTSTLSYRDVSCATDRHDRHPL